MLKHLVFISQARERHKTNAFNSGVSDQRVKTLWCAHMKDGSAKKWTRSFFASLIKTFWNDVFSSVKTENASKRTRSFLAGHINTCWNTLVIVMKGGNAKNAFVLSWSNQNVLKHILFHQWKLKAPKRTHSFSSRSDQHALKHLGLCSEIWKR